MSIEKLATIGEERVTAPTVAFLIPEQQSTIQSIKWLLLQGEIGGETILSRKRSGQIKPDDILSAGVELLKDGHIHIGDQESPLNVDQAASILHTLTSVAGNNNGHGRYLSMIARHTERPYGQKFYRLDPDQTLQQTRIDELETRVIDLLSGGYLDLYRPKFLRGMKRKEVSLYDKSIGLGIVNALSQIPAFRHDVRKWLSEVIKIPTTDGASIPHFIMYFLRTFNLYNPKDIDLTDRINGSGPSISEVTISYPIIRQTLKDIESIYKRPRFRKKLDELIALSRVNTGTGDTYAKLDEHTLPIIAELFGSNPKWLELAISRGVVWNGTLKRSKKIDMEPTWMFADLYHPRELRRASFSYHKIANSEDPFTLTPFANSDPRQAREEVDQIFKDPHYRGFIRSNFESKDFVPNVLKRWRRNTNSPWPEVIRMTGVLGMTEQSMKNLLLSVHPNGGVIIFSEANDLNLPRNTMWRVKRSPNNIKVELLHSGEDT